MESFFISDATDCSELMSSSLSTSAISMLCSLISSETPLDAPDTLVDFADLIDELLKALSVESRRPGFSSAETLDLLDFADLADSLLPALLETCSLTSSDTFDVSDASDFGLQTSTEHFDLPDRADLLDFMDSEVSDMLPLCSSSEESVP